MQDPRHRKPYQVVYIPGGGFEDNPQHRPIGKRVTKQVIGIWIVPFVTEYRAEIYVNTETNGRVHAPFPDGIRNEAEFDASVKGFVLALTCGCNVSSVKPAAFIRNATGGVAAPSHGFVTGLVKEFSMRTESDREQIYQDLSNTGIAHIDTSFVKLNGRNRPITVFTDGRSAWFSSTDHKGR